MKILKKFNEFKNDVLAESKKIYLKEDSMHLIRIIKSEITYIEESKVPRDWLEKINANKHIRFGGKKQGEKA